MKVDGAWLHIPDACTGAEYDHEPSVEVFFAAQPEKLPLAESEAMAATFGAPAEACPQQPPKPEPAGALKAILAAAERFPVNCCFHVTQKNGPSFCQSGEGIHRVSDHAYVSLSTLLSSVAELASERVGVESEDSILLRYLNATEPRIVHVEQYDHAKRQLAEVTQQRDSHLAVCRSIAAKVGEVFLGDSSLTLEKRVAWVCERLEKACGGKPGEQTASTGLPNLEARYVEAGQRLCPDGCDLVLPGALILAGDVDSAGKPVPEGWAGYAVRAENQVVFRPQPSRLIDENARNADLAEKPVDNNPTCERCGGRTRRAGTRAGHISDRYWFCEKCEYSFEPGGEPEYDPDEADLPGILPRIEKFEECGLLLSELPPAEARLVIAALGTIFSV